MTDAAPTKVSLGTFILSHSIWAVALVVALVLGNIALKEHDQRIAAQAQIKTSEATIAQLQTQISTTNAQAAAKVQTIVKIVHDLGPAPTPAQIVAAVPSLTDAPLNTRTIPGDSTDVEVTAIPFINFLVTAKTDEIELGACQANLTAETAITAQKNVEIAALKKKPSFLHRVGDVAKAVGVGIGVGLLIGGHL